MKDVWKTVVGKVLQRSCSEKSMVLLSGKYEGTVEAMGAPKDLYTRALAIEQKEFRDEDLNIA